jgi:hypothetical protein
VTTFGVGAAAGTAVVGPVIERGGAAAGFGVAGAGGIAALLVLLVTARALSVTPSGSQRAPVAGLVPGPGHASAPVAGAENDRNGAAEPGFRTGRQA